MASVLILMLLVLEFDAGGRIERELRARPQSADKLAWEFWSEEKAVSVRAWTRAV